MEEGEGIPFHNIIFSRGQDLAYQGRERRLEIRKICSSKSIASLEYLSTQHPR